MDQDTQHFQRRESCARSIGIGLKDRLNDPLAGQADHGPMTMLGPQDLDPGGVASLGRIAEDRTTLPHRYERRVDQIGNLENAYDDDYGQPGLSSDGHDALMPLDPTRRCRTAGRGWPQRWNPC